MGIFDSSQLLFSIQFLPSRNTPIYKQDPQESYVIDLDLCGLNLTFSLSWRRPQEITVGVPVDLGQSGTGQSVWVEMRAQSQCSGITTI